jgi:hypothetical protein
MDGWADTRNPLPGTHADPDRTRTQIKFHTCFEQNNDRNHSLPFPSLPVLSLPQFGAQPDSPPKVFAFKLTTQHTIHQTALLCLLASWHPRFLYTTCRCSGKPPVRGTPPPSSDRHLPHHARPTAPTACCCCGHGGCCCCYCCHGGYCCCCCGGGGARCRPGGDDDGGGGVAPSRRSCAGHRP